MRKRDKYVWAAIFNLTWYCIVSLVLTANDKIVPDSLTVAWFAVWTAELALLANAVVAFVGALIGISTANYNKDNGAGK